MIAKPHASGDTVNAAVVHLQVLSPLSFIKSGEVCLTGDRYTLSSLATGHTGPAFRRHQPE